MSKDKNFERRMIVSKYSNRPPFDLKKPKETYNILDRIKEYPIEDCRNCCRNRTKDCKNILSNSNKNSMAKGLDDNSKLNPGKKIIPKIIETFQKLNPFQDVEDPTMSKNTSIQTLYRNTRSCKLGKNIPKHKLMKSLLQNLDSEVDSCKKCSTDSHLSKGGTFSGKGRIKHKKCGKKKQFFDKNDAIRTDFTVTYEKKKNSEVHTNCVNIEQRPLQIDQKTSTTGLVWPPESKEIIQYSNIEQPHKINRNSFQRLISNQHGITSFKTIREESLKSQMPQFSSSSFLKEPPTKDLSQNDYVELTKSEKLLRRKVSSINELRQKSLEDSTIHKKQAQPRNQSYIVRSEKIEKIPDGQFKNPVPEKYKSREKSFVQTQVEKLNKVMRTTKTPGAKLSRPTNFNGGFQKRGGGADTCTRQVGNQRRDEGTLNYLGLMDRIRSNVPIIHKSDNYDSFGSDHDWSDTGTEINPEYIRFPKETKTAIDQRLGERKMKIPLSKYTKHHDVRPALPSREKTFDDSHYGYVEGSHHSNNREDLGDGYNVPPPTERKTFRKNQNIRKMGQLHAKQTKNLPCKKNLLCDRGEQHFGPCRYPNNNNKVVY